jgi:hypothetical protein
MATIITKNSQTASAVPSAASLEVGELAVNTADGKLYTEHTGGVVKEIIPSTVVDGGITAAKIASNAVTTAKIADANVTTAKIADANVTGAKLENSGVSAGTYGSASVVPVVTVDAKGRLTSVSTASIAASAPSTAQVLSATAGATLYAVGSYLIAIPNTGVLANNTIAGGNLRGYSAANEGYIPIPGVGGTWRAMGSSQSDGSGNLFTYGNNQNYPGLWLRIS